MIPVIAVLLLTVAGAAHAAEQSPDYRLGVCHGLRAAATLDPSQPLAVHLPGGDDFRCAPIDMPRGLPPATVLVPDCRYFTCVPYAIPSAKRVPLE